MSRLLSFFGLKPKPPAEPCTCAPVVYPKVWRIAPRLTGYSVDQPHYQSIHRWPCGCVERYSEVCSTSHGLYPTVAEAKAAIERLREPVIVIEDDQ